MIGISAALAVIYIIFGGIQYMSTDAVGAKKDGKKTIQNAILGLLLVIGSYSILYTVNPKLVNFNLEIPGIAGTTNTDGTSVIGVSDGTSSGGSTNPTSGPWYEDSALRNDLKSKGITINNLNCKNIGDRNCTSVYGLSMSVFNGLTAMRQACRCSMVITGGTEYWLHSEGTEHRPGGSAIDLRYQEPVGGISGNLSPLSTFLKKEVGGVTKAQGSGCTRGIERYKFGNDLYVNETISGNDPHWHVCFNFYK
jgi:hypothetical protein